jgi:hypothetical protein
MADKGWISKQAFQNNALSRDTMGRAAMENGYINDDKLEFYNIDGLHARRMARATYDFSEHGGAQGVISLGVALPDNAIVTRAWYEVLTTLQSGTDAATVSIDIPVDDVAGIVAAIAISDLTDPWDEGLHEAIQDGAAANFSVKTTAERTLQITIAGGEDLTAGKFILFAEYVVSD